MEHLTQRIRRKMKRIVRGGIFVTKWFFFERPKGLDFSLRQKQRGIHNKGNHGYALTQRSVFDNIMKELEVDGDDFIDIGCGKGGCLYYALRYKFSHVAGIEIEDSLYKTAKRNFDILKLSKKVSIFHEDAITFKRYCDYNVYYMFNPFDTDIYCKVLDNIIQSIACNKHERIYLCCYGASAKEYIEKTGLFILNKQYIDKARETEICIWYRKL